MFSNENIILMASFSTAARDPCLETINKATFQPNTNPALEKKVN